MPKFDLKTGMQVMKLRERLEQIAQRRGAVIEYQEAGPLVCFPNGHPYESHIYTPETEDHIHNTKRAITFLESR